MTMAKSMKQKSIKFAGMTIQEASQQLLVRLREIYDQREAAAITNLAMENLTGMPKMDRVMHAQELFDYSLETKWNGYLEKLFKREPVQYVLGEAWFMGMKFFVSSDVLIPRPETEELVNWVVEDNCEAKNLDIFDAGTGSGCIGISLGAKLPGARIICGDLSDSALAVARINATALKVDLQFMLMDMLDAHTWELLPMMNIIVSNPPYIPVSQKNSMHGNVVNYEPHAALFVDDDDVLKFYKALAAMGKKKLLQPGKIYVEVHEDLAHQTAEIFRKAGYTGIMIRKDMQEKERMVSAAV